MLHWNAAFGSSFTNSPVKPQETSRRKSLWIWSAAISLQAVDRRQMPVTFAHTPPTSVGPHSAGIFHAQAALRQIKKITLMRCGAEEETCMPLPAPLLLTSTLGEGDHCAHTTRNYCGLWVSIAQKKKKNNNPSLCNIHIVCLSFRSTL